MQRHTADHHAEREVNDEIENDASPSIVQRSSSTACGAATTILLPTSGVSPERAATVIA